MKIKGALKVAQNRWGKNGSVKKRPDAPNKEQRAEMALKAKEIRAKMDLLDKKSPEFEALRKEIRNYILPEMPCTVGRVELGMFFAVAGEGDTWEEAFEDADFRDAREHDEWYHKANSAPCIHCKAARKKARAK